MYKFLYIALFSGLMASCSSPEPVKSTINEPVENHNQLDSDLELAKAHALATKQTLGKNLISAIGSQGTAEALSFCDIHAIPLTDSMSHELDVKIKRVSDLPRNPDNLASERALQYIIDSKEKLASGEEVKSILFETENGNESYVPIMTNGLCLQCHGQKETEILPETLTNLSELYPEDKATGYSINQLRGIWVIEMSKK